MAEVDEENTGVQEEVPEPVPSDEPGVELEEPVPVYKQEDMPTGKVDQVMWWAFKGKTRKELEKPPYNYKPGTIRVGYGKLADQEPEWVEAQEIQEVEDKPSKAVTTPTPKTPQISSKGSAPEAIIENIKIPVVDGQAQGLEQGMKFGMNLLVLAVRVMQELSTISLQQVKPLIDMTRSVREGEAAMFKTGAEEGAMKAAQAMGNTIMPLMSEMQTAITNATKGSEADPMKSMMVRTMEPMMKRLLGRIVPGMESEPPSGWSRRSE